MCFEKRCKDSKRVSNYFGQIWKKCKKSDFFAQMSKMQALARQILRNGLWLSAIWLLANSGQAAKCAKWNSFWSGKRMFWSEKWGANLCRQSNVVGQKKSISCSFSAKIWIYTHVRKETRPNPFRDTHGERDRGAFWYNGWRPWHRRSAVPRRWHRLSYRCAATALAPPAGCVGWSSPAPSDRTAVG